MAAERAEVERFDDDAFIETEMPKARSLASFQRIPVDRGNGRARSDLELVERDRLRFEARIHLATDYQ